MALLRRIRNALPARFLASPAGRALRGAVRYGRLAFEELALRTSLSAHTLRLRLMAMGLPLKRQFLVVRCMEGEEASGLFSEMEAVLGALEHFDRWQGQYAGIRVDFGEQGLYYESGAGPNWWNYYFEPVDIGSADAAMAYTIGRWQHDSFVFRVEHRLPRAAAADILARYIHVRSELQETAARYRREHFEGGYVIGVHYRGTDKREEIAPVAYDAMADEVRRVAGTRAFRIYVATDEQPFLDYMAGRFPGQVLCRDLPRSVDGRPIHWRGTDGFQGGADAVTDCLILSRCDFLLRTTSHLSLSATLFNPGLPERLVAPGR